jgi:hypothetical protein
VDFNAGEEAADVGDKAGQEGNVPLKEGVGNAVALAGVKARVGQQYLQSVDRRRVVLEDGLDVVSQAAAISHIINLL